MKIWKWTLLLDDKQVLKIPTGAQILTVQKQGERISLWALCDEDLPEEKREIHIYGTNNPMPEDPGVYIATFQIYDGLQVYHAFEKVID